MAETIITNLKGLLMVTKIRSKPLNILYQEKRLDSCMNYWQYQEEVLLVIFVFNIVFKGLLVLLKDYLEFFKGFYCAIP